MNRHDTPIEIGWTWEDPTLDGKSLGGFVELTITGIVTAYDPGRRYGDPEHCYPPEGGELEDVECVVDSGELTDDDDNPIPLTDHLKAKLALAFLNQQGIFDQIWEACADA